LTAAELAKELDETTALVSAGAARLGHDLHPWALHAVNQKRTACRSCGSRAIVTVTASTVTIEGTASTIRCK
jgi:hypothetical protein